MRNKRGQGLWRRQVQGRGTRKPQTLMKCRTEGLTLPTHPPGVRPPSKRMRWAAEQDAPGLILRPDPGLAPLLTQLLLPRISYGWRGCRRPQPHRYAAALRPPRPLPRGAASSLHLLLLPIKPSSGCDPPGCPPRCAADPSGGPPRWGLPGRSPRCAVDPSPNTDPNPRLSSDPAGELTETVLERSRKGVTIVRDRTPVRASSAAVPNPTATSGPAPGDAIPSPDPAPGEPSGEAPSEPEA